MTNIRSALSGITSLQPISAPVGSSDADILVTLSASTILRMTHHSFSYTSKTYSVWALHSAADMVSNPELWLAGPRIRVKSWETLGRKPGYPMPLSNEICTGTADCGSSSHSISLTALEGRAYESRATCFTAHDIAQKIFSCRGVALPVLPMIGIHPKCAIVGVLYSYMIWRSTTDCWRLRHHRRRLSDTKRFDQLVAVKTKLLCFRTLTLKRR